MVRLFDVARELDVSVSLVSKVLNNRMGKTSARPELVEKIKKKAAVMGYRKNLSAISLVTRRQNTLAVLVYSHGAQGSGLVEKFLAGISAGARAESKRITLDFFETPEQFREKCAELHPGQVDGLIVSGGFLLGIDAELARIRKTNLPVVTVFNRPLRGIPNIGVPDADLSELATSHLIERGCRRILHFAVWEERALGHRRALRRARLPVRPELIVTLPSPEGFRTEASTAAIRDFLDRQIPFDGISAQSDVQAAACINELIRRGIRVPDDVKVAGIDNAPFTNFWIVPITSARQRLAERGRMAVEMLSRSPDQRKTPASISLEAQINVRASTGS